MKNWMGAVADRHIYAQPIDYVSDQGTNPTAPSSNLESDDSEVFSLLKKATNYFDRRTNRESGYWLKSRPFKQTVNGQGHNIIHPSYPMPVIRRIEDSGTLVAQAPYVSVPDTDDTPLFRVDARAIDLEQYSGITVSISSVNAADNTFDLDVKTPNGAVRERYTGVDLNPMSEDYLRRKVHDESDMIIIVRQSMEGVPAEGDYELGDGYDESSVRQKSDTFIVADGHEFTDRIGGVEIIGEVGVELSVPRDVRQAVIRIADLMDQDQIKEEEERYTNQSRSGKSTAPGYTGSHWVDLIMEDYMRKPSDSFLDIR